MPRFSGVDQIKSINYDLESISDDIDKLFSLRPKLSQRGSKSPLPVISQPQYPDYGVPRLLEEPGKASYPFSNYNEYQYSPKSNYSEEIGNFSIPSKYFANPQRPVAQPRSIEEFYNNPRRTDEPISLVKETKPRGLGFFNRNAPPYY
jgi:hypothetical protein